MGKTFASLVIAVTAGLATAACGGDATRDGGLRDGGGDAPVSGQVTVTVIQQGNPVAGAKVYFANPDGSQAALVDTDASGVASATMLGGGSVTAAYIVTIQTSMIYQLHTVLGAMPGDHITLGIRTQKPPAIYGTGTFFVPDKGTGTSYYYVYTGCGMGYLGEPPSTAGTQAPIGAACADPTGRFDAMARAVDTAGGYTYQIMTNQLLNADAGMFTGNYTFGSGWYSPVAGLIANITYPPTGWRYVTVGATYYRKGRQLFSDYKYNSYPTWTNPSTFAAPTSFADYAVISDVIDMGSVAVTGQPSYVLASTTEHRERDPVSGTTQIDTRLHLPKIHDPVITVANGQISGSFTADAAIDDADGGSFDTQWTDAALVPHVWRVYFPPGTHFTTPALPAALAGWTTQLDKVAFPSSTGYPNISIIDATTVGSYTAFRRDPYTTTTDPPDAGIGAFSWNLARCFMSYIVP